MTTTPLRKGTNASYAERYQRIGSENAFRIVAHIARLESAGAAVIRLNLGEPDFELPAYIAEEVKRQLDLGNTHYCDPQGVPAFRQAIARNVRETRGIDVNPARVVVFPGAKPAIAFVQHTYLNPGDEVIYPSPGFPIYESIIRVMDAVPVPLHLREETEFSFTGEELDRLITDRTKLIFLNFPSNPTGGVARPEQLESIARVIREQCHAGCRIFSDEIYEDIIFDGLRHYSIASFPGMAERTILVSGLSKSYSWTGGRLGYAVFPSEEEALFVKNLNINYFSCVPPFLQMAGAKALTAPQRDETLRKMVETFQARRDRVLPLLNQIDGVRCVKPQGAFYLFPNVEGVCRRLGVYEAFERLPASQQEKTSPATLFQMFALYRHRVAVMDRRSFGRIGSEGRHYLRLSIAANDDLLVKGVERLAAAADDRKGFWEFFQAALNLWS